MVEPWEEEIIRRRESECQESLTATAGDLVQSCPPNLTICIWSFNHRGNSPSAPVRSPPSPPPAQLNLLCPAIHCCPVSTPSRVPLIRILFHSPSSYRSSPYIDLDLQISRHLAPNRPQSPRSIPSGRTEPLPTVWLPVFSRRQRSPPLDLRSRLNQALSHLFFLLLPPSSSMSSQRPCPRQLPS